MRRPIILSAVAMLFAVPSLAQLNGKGYYRVQNVVTSRYIIMTDNKAKDPDVSTEVDLQALETIRGLDKVVSDPASVIYIEPVTGLKHNIKAQGVDAYKMIKYYLQLKKNTNDSYYKAFGDASKFGRIYINDMQGSDERGVVLSNDKNARDWNIIPISSSTNNYFGFTPDVSAGGKHYASFYGDFPFTFASSGLKAYYVSTVDVAKGVAVYRQISGTVPRATPMIVECVSTSPANNKVNVSMTEGTAVSGNRLSGVYFCRPNDAYPKDPHINTTKYDASTMRVLGTCKDGSIGFVKANITYLPANKAYLKVSAGSPDELKLMSYAEYTTGIETVTVAEHTVRQGVYTISGTKVSESNSTEGLPKGLYIVGGKKVVVK